MAQQLPRTLQPPPNLPDLGSGQSALANYLRNFSLWCRHGFADKLSATTATPALMMQTDDVPPAVYQLAVTSGPTLTLAPMMLGSGAVGDPIPATARSDATIRDLQTRVDDLTERLAALEAR